MKTLFFIQKQTFRLFSTSTSLGLGFLDSSENPLPPPPPPPYLEVISTQVLLLILILFIYLFCCLIKNFFFIGVNSIDFIVCEIHCGASKLGGTYFAQGNFFPFCLFTEKNVMLMCFLFMCLLAKNWNVESFYVFEESISEITKDSEYFFSTLHMSLEASLEIILEIDSFLNFKLV